MATVPPTPGSAQPPPPAPNDPSTAPQEPLNWDGDRMFNVYIYDYCWKRGFRKTARELMYEADLPEQAQPPIDAKQGLLFEWWSVFWVLFQAKSTNMPMDNNNAILYNQHQQLAHVRALRAHDNLAPIPGMAENERASAAVMGRPLPPNHPSPAGPAAHRGPGQPNGAGVPHPPISGSAPPQPPHGSQPHMFNGMQPGQRPMSMNGAPQPQHPPNGQQRPVGTPTHNLPFSSPTMAHSPNVQQQPRPPSQQAGPGPQNPTMGPLGGPPAMRGPMTPHNGIPQGVVMGGTSQQLQPAGNFQPMGAGRPPSRTTTPQMQSGMMQPSPSMSNRQPMSQQDAINVDFQQIMANPPLFHQLKQETGIPLEKNQFSPDDKRKVIEAYRARIGKAPGTPLGPQAGPSTPMQHPMQRPPQMQGPPQQNRAVKRNSTSPGEQPESSEASPPDRKRQRRSPMDTSMMQKAGTPTAIPGTPQSMAAIPPPPGQPQGHPQGHPNHMPPQPTQMMMRQGMGNPQGQMPMNGMPQPGPNLQHRGPPPGGQQMMGGQMGPAPQGQMGPPLGMGSSMSSQMNSGYAVSLHQVHNVNPPGMMQQGGPQGGPPGPGPQPQQQQFMPKREPNMVPQPPGGPRMMIPQSPANPAAVLKQEHKDGNVPSPRGLPGQPPNQQGGPSQQPQQPLGPPPGTPGPQGGQQHAQQIPGGIGPMGPPGNAFMPPGPMVGMDGSMIFDTDFNFADLGGSFPGATDTGIPGMDFERDFGVWFNGGDGLGDPAALDIK